MNCEPKKYRGLMIATIVLGAVLMVLGILSYPLMISSADAVIDLINASTEKAPGILDIIKKMMPLLIIIAAFFLFWIAYAAVAGVTTRQTSNCKKVSLKPAVIAVLIASIVLFFGAFGGSMGWFTVNMLPAFKAQTQEAAIQQISTWPQTMLPFMICSTVSGAAVIGFGTFECVMVSKK